VISISKHSNKHTCTLKDTKESDLLNYEMVPIILLEINLWRRSLGVHFLSVHV